MSLIHGSFFLFEAGLPPSEELETSSRALARMIAMGNYTRIKERKAFIYLYLIKNKHLKRIKTGTFLNFFF